MYIDIERLKTDAEYWDEVAPEGATHFDRDCGLFCKECGFWNNDSQWRLMPNGHSDWGTNRYIPRPTKTAAPEWDGGGLPPVGCEVEYYSESEALRPDECNLDEHCVVDTWKPGDSLKVIAYAKMPFGQDFIDIPVVQNAQTHEVSSLMQKYIRPIRTPEQRQRDELVDMLDKNRFVRGGFSSRPDIVADALIDFFTERYNLEPKDT